MTTEQQIKALAELDGWRQHNNYRDVMCKGDKEAHIQSDNLTCYLTSYDAIIPVIQKWCGAGEPNLDRVFFFRQRLRQMLSVIHQPNTTEIVNTLINATPAQLCEALLLATGKWEE